MQRFASSSLAYVGLVALLVACGGSPNPRPARASVASTAPVPRGYVRRHAEKPAPPRGTIVQLTPEITPPKLHSPDVVEYTPDAYRSCAEGSSIARCVITTSGDAADCKVLQSVPTMDEAVLDALSGSRFEPALRDGVAVNAECDIKMWIGPPGGPRPTETFAIGLPGSFFLKPSAPKAAPSSAATQEEAQPAESGAAAPESAVSQEERPAAADQPKAAPTNVVLPFGPGMERPKQLCGPELTYTREALENRVQGLAVIRCTLSPEGRVTHCRAIKPLGLMTQPIINAIESRRYTPILYKGKPRAVDYVFNVQLTLPTR